jgi:hypothetical protein
MLTQQASPIQSPFFVSGGAEKRNQRIAIEMIDAHKLMRELANQLMRAEFLTNS